MQPSSYDIIRYLSSKRSVDDRALNRRVLEAFHTQLGLSHKPLRVLELGAGLGSMVTRLWELGVIRDAQYTLVDRDSASLCEARRRLSIWGRTVGAVDGDADRLRVRAEPGALEVSFENSELFGYLHGCPAATFDVVLAHAVLDLLDVPSLLPVLWRALVPGAVVWLPLTFDGETIFLPELPLDLAVMHLYHRSMDERVVDGRAAGNSKTGRRLLEQFPASGASVLEAGSSDWIVHAREGRYPDDEAYFLHHIVETIDRELRGHADLDAHVFASWVQARHEQIATGELTYIAHQIDVLGRAPHGMRGGGDTAG